MARVTGALLEGRGVSDGATRPMLDLTFGGQFGYAPTYGEWVSSAPYTQRNLIPVLLEAPAFFLNSVHSATLVSNLRAMLETHPQSIEGLNSTLRVSTDETIAGGGGEVLEDVMNITRERSTPTFTWRDKVGRPIQSMLEFWLTFGMMDPETKYAGIGTWGANAPSDMLPDRNTASMMFIEPDPTMRKVEKAWLCVNMFPKSAGDNTGRMDKSAGLAYLDLNVEFSAFTQRGQGVNNLAQNLLDFINITNANPNMRAAHISQINAEVEAATQAGFAVGVQNLAQNVVAVQR